MKPRRRWRSADGSTGRCVRGSPLLMSCSLSGRSGQVDGGCRIVGLQAGQLSGEQLDRREHVRMRDAGPLELDGGLLGSVELCGPVPDLRGDIAGGADREAETLGDLVELRAVGPACPVELEVDAGVLAQELDASRGEPARASRPRARCAGGSPRRHRPVAARYSRLNRRRSSRGSGRGIIRRYPCCCASGMALRPAAAQIRSRAGRAAGGETTTSVKS